MRNSLVYTVAVATVLAVALVYWPTLHGDFVWDDWRSFHDTPWLTQGDLWKHYIFRDFNSWTYYFRPLPLALFTLQVRLFHATPGPMHAVSLGLHLLDMLLVGALAWRLGMLAKHAPKAVAGMALLCMLLYGLHPALIEPVSWIGCQFDLIATGFMLTALLANAWIARTWLRAATIGLAFFLAACSKESAAAFPLLLLVFDWVGYAYKAGDGFITRIKALLARNLSVYLTVLAAGVAYLGFRFWALGGITSSFEVHSATPLARLQEICFVCFNYWRVLVWPVADMSPIHPYETQWFAHASPLLISVAAAVIGILALSVYAALRRGSVTACIVLAATLALLPVLHIVPVQFEQSLYHERYAMMSIAIICSMLPLLPWASPQGKTVARIVRLLATTTLLFWLAFAIIDIRLIVPNWASDTQLWSWALYLKPHASQAKDNLLHTYMKNGDAAATRKLGDRILADSMPCTYCTLVIAKLALDENDPLRAQLALEKSAQSPRLFQDSDMLHDYYLYAGRLLAMQGRHEEAVIALRKALLLSPGDTAARGLLQDVMQLPSQTIR